MPALMAAVYASTLLFTYPRLSLAMLFVSLGLGSIVHSIYDNICLSFGVAAAMLLLLAYLVPRVDGFNTRTPPSEILKTLGSKGRIESFKSEVEDDEEESGSEKPEVDGYEDVKSEKNESPAPAMKKNESPMPFKLGEIPSQAKGGPHIDAGSTLMKAIQSLNPDQINAMSKDTQQLIETQKSLMGMLGTMKPMLNDGKQLMETFQQMFGQ
jgi:hypothetical protein